MTQVLVVLAGRASRCWRGGRPGTAASTDPGLVIDREHQGVGGWRQVQPAHVGRALPEGGVIGAGDPAAHPVGLDVQVGQDPADLGRGAADVGQRLGQLGMAPVAGRLGWLLGHRGQDLEPLVVAVDQWAARPRAVLQAGQTLSLEATPPVAHGVLVHADHGGDLAVGDTLGRQQHHPCPLGGPLWGGVGTHPALQFGPFTIGDAQGRHGWHGAAPHRGDEQPSHANN